MKRLMLVITLMGHMLCAHAAYSSEERENYLHWLAQSVLQRETGVGKERLASVKYCMEDVARNNIPGDFIEAGVLRGGVTIFMRGFLFAYGDRERQVWVADSFEGFPPTDRPNELCINNQTFPDCVCSLEQVVGNFEKYGLLDDQVHFLKGFFCDTLPIAPIEKLAILRLDGDLYSSTMDALEALYPKLSIGGYVIIDDYGWWPGCREAVHDFREKHQITEIIEIEDFTGIHWKKLR